MVDTVLYISYILVGICALLAIVLPLINAFSDLKSLKIILVGLAFLLVIWGISWGISGDEIHPKATSGISQNVGGGLIMMYILVFLTILGILYSEVKSIFE